MAAEQTKILEMLAGDRISVEEAERLLAALAAGQQKRDSEERKGSARKQQAVQEALNSVKETLAGIGPMVGRMVGEVTTEFQKDRNYPGENEAEELPELEIEGDKIPVDEGEKLFLRNDKEDGPGGGDLLIEGSKSDDCSVDAAGARNLRLMRSSSGPVLRWSGGPLRVKVPAKVAEVFAYTLGGDGEVSELDCPIQLKSMGGDLRLTHLQRRFTAKTMGGNIRISLGDGRLESSEAKTMGGNIRIEVDAKTPAVETEAVTLGGAILVEDEFGKTKRGGGLGKQKIALCLGEGDATSTLKVKTMGGNIEIRRTRHEQ